MCTLCFPQTTQKFHLSSLVPSGNTPDGSMIERALQEWWEGCKGNFLALVGEDTEAVRSREECEGLSEKRRGSVHCG